MLFGRRYLLRSAPFAAAAALLLGAILAPVVHGSGPSLDLLGFGQVHGPDAPVNILPGQLHTPPTFATVDAGQAYTLAVDPDGNVWTWGANGFGQLGNGSIINTTDPAELTGVLPTITRVAANNGHSLALDNTGNVWAWGANFYGQLGDGTIADETTPISIPHFANVTSIAAGFYFSLALDDQGNVWAWGNNIYLTVVNDSQVPYVTQPTEVVGLSDIVAISAGGNNAAALTRQGVVYTWGSQFHGDLGNGGPTNITAGLPPAPVTGLPQVSAIDAGDGQVLALGIDGSVWDWGWNHEGQVGDGSFNDRSTPLSVVASGVISIAGGGHHSLALLGDGTVLGWGYDPVGQLGPNQPFDSVTAPVLIQGLSVRHVDAVFAGELSSFVLADPLPGTVLKPDPPTNVRGFGSPGQATIFWNVPASDGGSPITSYTAIASPGGLKAKVEAFASSITIPGLTNGVTYTITMVATNDVGDSPMSLPSDPIIVAGPPGAPTNVFALRGNGQVSLSWQAPAVTGGDAISRYFITTTPGGSQLVNSPATNFIVTGLTNGTSYTFTVRAGNSVTSGPFSAPSNAVTPAGPPDAPTIGPAIGGIAKATVSWTAPAFNGGSGITGYRVTSSPGGISKNAASGASSATVTGLSNGTTYTFTVVAINAVGTGLPSAPSNSVTPAALIQTITFANPGTRLMTQSPYTIIASTNSNLALSYATSDATFCSFANPSSPILTFVAAGPCTVTVSQAGDVNYNAASLAHTFAINRAAQVITFAQPGNQPVIPSTYAIVASTPSNLPLTYSTTSSTVCAFGDQSSPIVTFLAVGPCVVTVSQFGDFRYLPRSQARTITVVKANQTIIFGPILPQTLGGPTLFVNATAGSGGVVVFTSSSPNVCTVGTSGPSGTPITFLKRGQCTLAANQPGDVNWNRAPQVVQRFQIQ